MRVDVRSDMVCPCCTLGTAHLHAALAEAAALAGFEHVEQVEIRREPSRIRIGSRPAYRCG